MLLSATTRQGTGALEYKALSGEQRPQERRQHVSWIKDFLFYWSGWLLALEGLLRTALGLPVAEASPAKWEEKSGYHCISALLEAEIPVLPFLK